MLALLLLLLRCSAYIYGQRPHCNTLTNVIVAIIITLLVVVVATDVVAIVIVVAVTHVSAVCLRVIVIIIIIIRLNDHQESQTKQALLFCLYITNILEYFFNAIFVNFRLLCDLFSSCSTIVVVVEIF